VRQSLRPWIARVTALEPLRVAAYGFGAIFVFGALGSYDTQTFDVPAFNLNREGSVPSIFATALWIGAGLMALAVAASDGRRAASAWAVIGTLLVYLGVDEAFAVHEALERLAGVSYQRLYLPLMVAGGIAGAVVLVAVRRDRRVAALLVTGAGCAAAAQLVDLAQWEDERLVLPYWTTVPEELLEMTGLLLVGLAALVEARRAVLATAVPADPVTAAPVPAEHPVLR